MHFTQAKATQVVWISLKVAVGFVILLSLAQWAASHITEGTTPHPDEPVVILSSWEPPASDFTSESGEVRL